MKTEMKTARILAVRAKLLRGENVQNRQMRTLIGEEEFARFECECREQQELRETLRQKPQEIVEFERLLKKATFTYSKADAASRQGRRQAAQKMFSSADTEFERVAEYLSEQIAGRLELELWLDRDVHFDAANAPTGSPDAFPRVVTSRSSRRKRGGMLTNKQSKRGLKLAAVERVLEFLKNDPNAASETKERLAAGRKLKRYLEG